MNLHARPVELGLDGDLAERLDRVGRRPRLREHRLHGAPDLEPLRAEAGEPLVACERRDAAVVVRHLQRALDGRDRLVVGAEGGLRVGVVARVQGRTRVVAVRARLRREERLGDRVPDGPLADADPHLAEHQPREERRLGGVTAIEQAEQRVELARLAAVARRGRQLPQRRVELGDGERVAALAEGREPPLAAEVEAGGDRADLARRREPVFDVGRGHVGARGAGDRLPAQRRADIEGPGVVRREDAAEQEPGDSREVVAVGRTEQVGDRERRPDVARLGRELLGARGERGELHGRSRRSAGKSAPVRPPSRPPSPPTAHRADRPHAADRP